MAHEADAEVIWLAWRGLRELGLSDVRLWIGSVGLLFSLLNGFDLSESARAFIAGGVKELANGSTGVAELVARAEESDLVKSASGKIGQWTADRAGSEQAGENCARLGRRVGIWTHWQTNDRTDRGPAHTQSQRAERSRQNLRRHWSWSVHWPG